MKKETKLIRSAKRSGREGSVYIEASTKKHKAQFLYLDPLSFNYRKQLKSLLKAGYEIEEPFNHVYYKNFKDKKTKESLYTAYNGAIKLTYKGD